MIEGARKTRILARIVAGAAFAFGIGCLSVAAASPEEEIARLDRVRANLFEELIKTRAELAAVRAELQAALKARELAEGELARKAQQPAALPAQPSRNTAASVVESPASGDPPSTRPPAPAAIAPVRLGKERPNVATSAQPGSGARREAAKAAPQAPRARNQAEPRRSSVAAPLRAPDASLPSSLRLARP
jgi:hypothetical protein